MLDNKRRTRKPGVPSFSGDTAAPRWRLSVIAGLLRGSASLSLAEPELRGLPQLVRPGDVCFDVGAAYGMYSFTLAELVGPGGAVYSFEPQPAPRRILRTGRSSCGLEHLHVSGDAVGEHPGEREMALPVKFGFAPIHGHAHVNDGVQQPRPTTTLSRTRSWRTPIRAVDEFCETNAINRVEFMKIDVEGFEPTVIAGAERLIKEHLPTLLLEIEDRHLSRYGTTSGEFTNSLHELGYTMYTWNQRAWVRTASVTPETRNYLFAVDSAWNR